jgi:hypothetical protein
MLLLVTAGWVGSEPVGGEPLRLVWRDAEGQAEPVRTRVFSELDRMLGGAGVTVLWTVWDGSVRDAHASEISIDIESRPPAHWPALTMAVTRPETRHIWVFMGNVRRALRLSPASREPLSLGRAEKLGRALARILAHELVHAGAPEEPHTRAGLMSPSLGEGVLTAPLLALDATTRQALRASAIVRPEETTLAAADFGLRAAGSAQGSHAAAP